MAQTVGPGEKFKPTNLKEAPVSENAPFQSQRHATKFTMEWGKKVKPTLLGVKGGGNIKDNPYNSFRTNMISLDYVSIVGR